MRRDPGSGRCDGRAPILTTHGLSKDFGALRAVDGLDMEVCRGDVFGFLGPNGAGKTTVIRLVARAHPPHAGAMPRSAATACPVSGRRRCAT